MSVVDIHRATQFSTLEIHFVFFMNEFREGTYPRKARGLKRVRLISRLPGLEQILLSMDRHIVVPIGQSFTSRP